MRKTNYHTHTTFCDGRNSVSEMCSAAEACGYSALGFSSHAPLPFETGWTMKRESLPSYASEIAQAKDTHAGGISVFLGLEIDYLGESGPSTFDAGLRLDFSIGSVHYARPSGTEPFAIDEPLVNFAKDISSSYLTGNDLVREYFRSISEMVSKGGFDILGHFDLIRKNNSGGRYFDESSREYKAHALEALDSICAASPHPIILEVNTGAVARGTLSEPYPCLWLLEEALRRKIRITISADAHKTDHFAGYYEIGAAHASKAGYSTVWELGADGWIERTL